MIFRFSSLPCKIITSLIFVTFTIVISEENLELKNDTSAAETLFKRLYKLERNEQLAAVKALLKIDKPDRQRKMLEAITTKVLYVIKGCKLILEDEDFIPGESMFPSDERIRDVKSFLEEANEVVLMTQFLKNVFESLPNLVYQENEEYVYSMIVYNLIFSCQKMFLFKKMIFHSESHNTSLANVLENTAFIGDIIVRLPTMSLTVLEEKPEWMSILQWSLNFTNQSGLIDIKTTKLLNLVSQELNFTEKSPDFKNPYKREKLQIEVEDQDKKNKSKKKKTIPRGPRLSSRQFGEL